MQVGTESPRWAKQLVNRWVVFNDRHHNLTAEAFIYYTDYFETEDKVRVFSISYETALKESLGNKIEAGLYATYIRPEEYFFLDTPKELDDWTDKRIKEAEVKQAGVSLIINDEGLILAISRRKNKEIFGLPGGKFDPEDGDVSTKDTAIRETREETSVVITDCDLVYKRVEPADSPDGMDFYSHTYYVKSWSGIPQNSEEGEVKWLSATELVGTKAAFGKYNKDMLTVFKQMYPNVFIKGM